MSVLGNPRRVRQQRNQFVRPIHRLDRGNAELLELRAIEDRVDQILKFRMSVAAAFVSAFKCSRGFANRRQVRAESQIVSPAAKVDPADDDLTIARGYQRINLANDFPERE